MVYHIKLFPVTSLISFLQKLRYLFLWGNIKNIANIGILCRSRCQIKADHLTEQEKAKIFQSFIRCQWIIFCTKIFSNQKRKNAVDTSMEHEMTLE